MKIELHCPEAGRPAGGSLIASRRRLLTWLQAALRNRATLHRTEGRPQSESKSRPQRAAGGRSPATSVGGRCSSLRQRPAPNRQLLWQPTAGSVRTATLGDSQPLGRFHSTTSWN